MASIPRVSPAEASALLHDGYTYLDVRSEPEFAAGHPAGAHNVPLMHAGPEGMRPNPDFLDVMLALYPRDARLVVGCRSGQRSARAAELLAQAGYTDLVDQRAGFDGVRSAFGGLTEAGWSASGLPVETTSPAGSYEQLRRKAGKS